MINQLYWEERIEEWTHTQIAWVCRWVLPFPLSNRIVVDIFSCPLGWKHRRVEGPGIIGANAVANSARKMKSDIS